MSIYRISSRKLPEAQVSYNKKNLITSKKKLYKIEKKK